MKRGSDMLHGRSVAPKRHVHSPSVHTHSLSGTHVRSASTHSQNTYAHMHTPAEQKTHSALDMTNMAAHTHYAHACAAQVTHAGHMHALSTHRSHTADRLHALDAPRLDARDLGLACSSPVPAAVSLFCPDISAKTASDLLIKLSEATQKAQMKPGTRVESEPRRETLPAGQEEEPGPALSPDGPGASPEPPTLTHTPEGDTTHILASELLRKLAERQDMTCQGVKVKVEEEEEPMEVAVNSDLIPNGTVTEEATLSGSNSALHSLKVEEQYNPGASMEDSPNLGAKMEEQGLLSIETGKQCCSLGETDAHFSNVESNTVPGINMVDNRLLVRVKRENDSASGAEMEYQGLSGAKVEYQGLSGAKVEYQGLSGAKVEYQGLSGAKMVSNDLQFRIKTENDCFPGVKMEDLCLSGVKMEDQPFIGSKLEDQLLSGAKLPDQCLRAVLWQDMSVNLASTLLHQLSEKVSKANNHSIERTSPPKKNSPLLKVTVTTPASENSLSDTARSQDCQTTFSSNRTISSYFYRCHVCGFETEGRGLFLDHMTVHRQWELSSYSLHCCVCGLSTNQEPEMRAHMDTHSTGGGAITGETGSPSPSVATATTIPVTMATQTPPSSALGAASSSNEHRCRICQRLFSGQQELLVHFQGHRQGNQYRCDLCGHLTRTANKLVEHVRVHTGERPFTCDLCPYSAKRRDSLRLHCKVKHPMHVSAARTGSGDASSSAGARDAVHTHRSYSHGEAQQQRCGRNGQLAHRAPGHASSTSPFALSLHPSLSERPAWRDLSPLLPITTLLSLKRPVVAPSPGVTPSVSPPSSGGPPPISPPSSGSASVKHSFLAYLGLMGSS